MLDLFLSLAGELGSTLVTSLHDLPVARGRFDRLVGLRAGRIVFDAELRAAVPEHSFEELYAL